MVLIQGPEEFLAARAVQHYRARLRSIRPDLERTLLDASTYSAGELQNAVSPSLFGEPKLIEVGSLATMNDAFLVDALEYVSAPDPDVAVVLLHGGGVRGKKLLDAIKASGAPLVECQPLKRDSDKADFAAAEFRRAERRIEPAALRSLIAAVGSSLADLSAACSQLIADTVGPISVEIVDKYYAGRVEATAFRVADAAVSGNTSAALSALRYALATGVDPVPLVATLAMKVRTLARVFSAHGSSTAIAKDLGMQAWQIDQARRDMAGWSAAGLARAITVLAQADAEVKGAAKDPVYAVEHAVTVIARAARSRTR